MDACPTLHTERLILRQFQASDADTVHRLAGVKEVAAGTLLPHPYDLEAAAKWIAQQQESFAAGNAITFAIQYASVLGLPPEEALPYIQELNNNPTFINPGDEILIQQGATATPEATVESTVDPAAEIGDLEALQGVAKFPVRVKCALLAWKVLREGLDQAKSPAAV